MGTERWAPYKELWSSVQGIVLQRNDRFHHFKSLLRKHKPDFLNLLRNPVKNSEHRAKVKKANSEGLCLKGDTTPQLFSQDLIDEALIISDLFNLNELSAAELIVEGERQKPHYPQLTRGLVAVLLYWDGRKCLTGTLKTLIQCRQGFTWTLEVSEEVVEFVTAFTDELLEHGMTKQILKLVSDMQVEKEMESLAKQRGLGGAQHRKQVRDLISGVRQDLAECLFNFAGQSNLPLKDTMSILDHLENVESSADDKLSTVNVTLLHSLFYAFALPQDVAAQQDEQALQLLFKHPLLAEKDFIQAVHKRLMKREDWKTPGLKACVQLSWALSLRSVAQIPMALMEAMPDILNSLSFTEALEQDETILDSALTGKVFQYLKENIISCPEFRNEEFFIRRIHGLVTDLIVNMPLKVKEMKNRGDEVSRIILLHVMQREEPPTLREDFKHLLELITALYEHDEADLQLSVEYWCPASDAFPNGSSFGARRHQRLPQRQISLFKFLRQSGDMLPPLLYIPYLKMLAALSNGPYSARMAFEMLRANGSNLGGISEGSTISWDHFFQSIHRYYNNLKHDTSYHDHPSQFVQSLGAVGNQSYLQATHQMTITPQEVDGLRAVLQLLARIVENDDTACLAVHEHPTWNACNGLLGLLQCNVPATLKGDILLALNQLARIPEISLGLLQAMESIVEVNPQTATVPTKRSISMELEEVEARAEQYHMTRGFLKLTASLLDANNLVNFISGNNSVGFEPYLKFAIDRVFLKFMSRSYKQDEEKYEVATNTLKIFVKLLEQYVPHADHFAAEKKPLESSFSRLAGSLSQTGFQDSMNMSMNSTQGGVSFCQPTSKPPGYLLLLHIMNEGNFCKTILEVVENCMTYLDRFHVNHELEKHLAEASLLALQLIKLTLGLQDSFLSCMRESGCPILVVTLDKLLLGINPRTAKADYIITITKYICHNATHPQLSLCANEIISCLCRISTSTQREVYSILTSTSDMTRRRILHGFVEAIESPRPEIDEDQDKDYDLVDAYHSRCRLTILRLLLLCIDLPAPNLSHFFLGFNLTKPSKTSLQDAGVMESPRTCLHSILSILSFGPEGAKNNSIPAQPTAVTETPAMAELCYQLIYRLAANVETSGPVLRYLRSSHDFVYRHLQHLPFKCGGNAKENQLSLQQSWLLQTTAIEIFSTASNRQRSHTQRLIQMLFEKQGAPPVSILGTSMMSSALNSSSTFPGLGTTAGGSNLGLEMSMTSSTSMNGTLMNKNLQPQNELPQMLRILEELDFIQDFPDPLDLDEFVLANVENALLSCERTNEHGLVYCDLKALGDLLQANVNALQGSDDVERRARASHDVENILRTAIERNQTRQSIHSKLALLNAWRHTLEVSLCACPADLISKDTKQQILLDILQELMCRVLHADAMAELTAPVAPICLTLVAHLRSCFASQGFGEAQRRSGLVSDVSAYQDLNLSQIIQGGPTATIPQNVASSLQVIMKDITEWLLQAGVLPQVRANLYASLLYYLQMCQKPKAGINKSDDSPSLVGLQSLSMDVYAKLSRDNIKLLRTYGDVLMELVCKDACDGHSICRILALSVLDAIVRIDWEQTWLQFMVKMGYVGIIARSFTQEDEALQQALTPNSDAVRSLYIYEQKMAFISTISQTQMGARAILDAGILSRLAECSFLEMRPTINETGFDSFLPSLMSRYRQLLFPALKVCSSILSTFGGSSHFEASSLVFEFMLAHVESIVNPVLKLQPVLGDVQSLMELNFVTGILCQVAGQDFSSEALAATIPQPVLVELQAHQSRIQRQLLSLLPHYCVNDRWLKDIERNNQNRDNAEDTQEINLLVHQICANLMSYCTAIMKQKTQNLGVPILLFAPRLDEAVDTDSMSRQGVPRQPSIGLLVDVLRNSVSKFCNVMDLLSSQKRQLNNVNNLTTQELKEITGCEDQKLSIPQRQSIATIKLRNTAESQEKLLSSLHFITENSLLLLWQHLDAFVVKSSYGDSAPEGILFRTKGSGNVRTPVRKMQDIPDVHEGRSSMFRKSNTLGIGRDTVDEIVKYISPVCPCLPAQCITVKRGIGCLQAQLLRICRPTKDVANMLKRVLPTCLTDQFLVKLCDIETRWNERHTCTFIRPIVRRLQRIMKLHTS